MMTMDVTMSMGELSINNSHSANTGHVEQSPPYQRNLSHENNRRAADPLNEIFETGLEQRWGYPPPDGTGGKRMDILVPLEMFDPNDVTESDWQAQWPPRNIRRGGFNNTNHSNSHGQPSSSSTDRPGPSMRDDRGDEHATTRQSREGRDATGKSTNSRVRQAGDRRS